MAIKSNRSLKYKGVLENAGLGEFSYYMKKAGTYVQYAEYALENTNFNEIKGGPTELFNKIQNIRKLAAEVAYEMEQLPIKGSEIIAAHEEAEADNEDKKNVEEAEADNEDKKNVEDDEGSSD